MTHYGLSHITHPTGPDTRRPIWANRFTWFCIAAVIAGAVLAGVGR